ncbi:MAG: toxin-activating lysine-acyltransferase [Hyphomicrobium sp.]
MSLRRSWRHDGEKRSGVIAPFGGAEEMVKDLKEKVFPAEEIHFLSVNKDGKQVRVM